MNTTCVAMCYVKGGDFDTHYVEYISRIRDGVKQHSTVGVDFICITDEDISMIEGVKQVGHPKAFRSWYCRNSLFHYPIFAGYERVLYVDLDTIITGDIDNLLTDRTSRFSVIEDVVSTKHQLQYGVFMYDPELEWIKDGSLYNFCAGQIDDPLRSHARLINMFLKKINFKPSIPQRKYKICSYKKDIVSLKKNPKSFQICCFHGHPRPHEVNWSLNPHKLYASQK